MMTEPKVRILVCFHKPFPSLRTGVLIPMHVGRACAPGDVARSLRHMIGDDTGITISAKNPHFCELTAMYWAWKNPEKLGNPTHIGFFHYRRYLNVRDRIMKLLFVPEQASPFMLRALLRWSDRTIRRKCRDRDILIPVPVQLYENAPDQQGGKDSKRINMYEHYRQDHHHAEDFDVMMESIAEKYPRYKETADRVIMNHTEMYWLNMPVMRWDIFERYAEFIFGVLFEAEKRIDVTGYDPYDARVFGFLAERLTSVFIEQLRSEKAPVRIEEIPVVSLEIGTWAKYIKNVLHPYIPSPILSARRRLLGITADSGAGKSLSRGAPG